MRLFPPLLLAACLAAGAAPAGQTDQAARRYDSFGPERVRVEGDPPERVHLSVSVLDPAGRPVLGLDSSDFRVYEAGVPQALLDFGTESERRDRPLSVVFLVDRSGSVRRQMGKWRQAGAALVSALRPIDEVRLATFTTEVSVLQDFTHDAGRIAATVETLGDAGGGTRVFDAVDETLAAIGPRPGRKVIFLLTDGLDEVYADAWTVSASAYLTDLVRRAVQDEVTVVTIVPGPTARPFLAAQDLAVQTGGWWVYPSDDLPALVSGLGERLLESYYLAYDSTRAPGDDRRRALKVELRRDDLKGCSIRTVGAVYGSTPLLELLASRLEADDEEARVRAATDLALVTEGRDEAAAILLRLLKDENAGVRAAAAGALGRMGRTSAFKRVSRLLSDEDPAVREAAAGALRRWIDSGADEAMTRRIREALGSAPAAATAQRMP